MAASSPLIDGRRITDLRVADLKLELEHRGIESKGLKADLVKRLEKVRVVLKATQQSQIKCVFANPGAQHKRKR